MLRPRTLAALAARARRGPARDRRHRAGWCSRCAACSRRPGLARAGHLLPGRGRRGRRRALAAARADRASSSRSEAIAAVEAEGYEPNVYVDDELYVSRVTPRGRGVRRASSTSRSIRSATSCAWLDRAADEARLRRRSRRARRARRAAARAVRRAALRSRSRCRTSSSSRRAGVTKGSGLDFLAGQLGFTPEQTIAFGDGENDVELSSGPATASRSRTRTSASRRSADWICPPAAEEGVAAVLEALVHSRP